VEHSHETHTSPPLRITSEATRHDALAAGAAGASLLAAQPAQAKIVYTPAHKKLPLNQYFFLDLNHDGVKDFKLYVLTYATPVGENWDAAVNLSRLNARNAAVGKRDPYRYFASALKAGVSVGKTRHFPNQTREVLGWAFGRYSGGTYGPWTKSGKPVNDRYLGLRFLISGQVHYGWARLNVWIHGFAASATLTGYATKRSLVRQLSRARRKARMTPTSKVRIRSPSLLPLPNLAHWACSHWDHPDYPSGSARKRLALRSN
jgi:hypothetical protein